MEEKFIDVKRIIASKNPRLARWMPGFIMRYLKRKTRQKEINQFLAGQKDVNDVAFCQAVVDGLKLKLEAYGEENIPMSGGCIFACNHPLGGVDAMALATIVGEKRRDIKFIVNDLLLNLKNLKGMFAGVNKHGKNSKESLRQVDLLFSTDQAVFVFPNGLVSRRVKGEVKDQEWKKTFITRSKKYNKPIIPVYLNGELSNFFYRLANFRSKIGVKTNVEMLYLADELFKQEGNTLSVVFGEPIKSETFDQSKNDKQWAEDIKERVYALKVKLNS